MRPQTYLLSFEDHLTQHGIELREIVGPLDRVAMKLLKLKRPLGFGNYWLRSLWFSTSFALLFVLIALAFIWVPSGINLFTVIPLSVLLGCLGVLMSFGFLPAYLERRHLREKYGQVLSLYLEP